MLVQWQGRNLLVDTAPEMRLQAIRSHIQRIDAILFTHTHADHLFGLDDVRRYNAVLEGEMPIFGRGHVLDDLRRVFRYVFVPTQLGGGKPQLDLREIAGEQFEACGLSVEAIPVYHGEMEVTGFRFGPLAYVTDVSRIPDESRERLRGLDTLILGALRYEPHPTHFSIDEAVAAAQDLGARRTYFVHLSHEAPHVEISRRLPPNIRLAYDGLIVDVPETGDA